MKSARFSRFQVKTSPAGRLMAMVKKKNGDRSAGSNRETKVKNKKVL